MLYNLRDGAWDPYLLDMLDIPESMLPEVVDSSGIIAESDEAILGRPIPIAGIAGDQQAALFGQGCWEPGSAKNTYGTGCFILEHTGKKPVFSKNGLLTTVASRIGGKQQFAMEGSIFIAGAAVQWLRDGLGIIKKAADSEALAASVPDSGGVYVVPAFSGLGAPHWDMYARGTIVGLTRGTTAAHITRATLEAIALQTLDIVELMERETGARMPELRVDGGATPERPPDADPGRRPRPPRPPRRHLRDHRARRRLPRRPRRRLLEGPQRDRRPRPEAHRLRAQDERLRPRSPHRRLAPRRRPQQELGPRMNASASMERGLSSPRVTHMRQRRRPATVIPSAARNLAAIA